MKIRWPIAACVIVALGASGVVAQPATKVKIVEPLRVLSFAPVYVAIEKGFFKAEGLEVDIVSGGGGPGANAALLSGDVQFGQLSSAEIMKIVKAGQPVLAICALNSSLTMQVVVSKALATARGVSPRDPLEKKLAALKGATMGGVSLGGPHEHFLRFNMTLAGLRPEDVTVVRIGGGTAMAAALEKGQIDGFIISPPSGRQVEERGTGYIWIDPTEVPEYRAMIWQALVAKRDFIEKNPRLAEGMARAAARGINYMRKHPDEIAAIVEPYFRGQPLRAVDLGIKEVMHTFVANGVMTPEAWANAAKPLQRLGHLGAVDTREGGFWTNRYIVNVPAE